MNPKAADHLLFGGIPRNDTRGPRGLLSSLSMHGAAVGLLLLAVPQLVVPSGGHRPIGITLNMHPEPAPFRERVLVPKPIPVRMAAVPQRPLPPLPLPPRPRMTAPKLEEAPALPNAPRPDNVLPLKPAPVISPPVQTGVFASNLVPKTNPALPVPRAQNTGFDRAAVPVEAAAAPRLPVANLGLEATAADSRPVTATVHTGAFGQAIGGDPHAAKGLAANITRTEFDAAAGGVKPSTTDSKVRTGGFEEPKAVSVPVRVEAPASPTVRAVEILDKPKPAYTAEARQRKIEGTVLLDVIFSATGEVHVLRVIRGLGYGLDENAMEAARLIRYTPAKQAGAPVDQRVTLHVVFEITG
jgi:TonB family protein